MLAQLIDKFVRLKDKMGKVKKWCLDKIGRVKAKVKNQISTIINESKDDDKKKQGTAAKAGGENTPPRGEPPKKEPSPTRIAQSILDYAGPILDPNNSNKRKKPKILGQYPAPDDICNAEYEAERYEKIYNGVLKVKRIYFGEVGIKSELLSILELADRVPSGLNEEPGDRKSLPLHSAVYNTYINTLKRFEFDIEKCRSDITERCDELQMPLTKEDLQKGITELIGPIKKELDNITKDDSALEKALYAYKQTGEIAESSAGRYSDAVKPEMTKKSTDFCKAYIELLNCTECKAMESFETATEGSEVCEIKDTAGQSLTPLTYAYWLKLQDFAEKIKIFLNEWNEEKFK